MQPTTSFTAFEIRRRPHAPDFHGVGRLAAAVTLHSAVTDRSAPQVLEVRRLLPPHGIAS